MRGSKLAKEPGTANTTTRAQKQYNICVNDSYGDSSPMDLSNSS